MSEQKKALEEYYADVQSGVENPRYNLIAPNDEIIFNDLQTVTDFESDEEVIKDYSLVIDALARNKTYTSGILDSAAYSDDGPSEFFRDLTSRIGTKVNIASEVKNWSDEEKQAFTRMQTKWDNVSVSGLKEYMGVIKDYGIDAVANLESIPALASLIFQGGTGVAAAQVTSRAALSKVLAKVAAASSPTTKKGFAAYGAAFGGAEDISLQNLQIETGAKEDFSLGNVAVAAGLGAVAGAGLKKGMELFKGRNTSRLANKQAEIDLENKLIVEIPEEDGLKVFEAGLAKGDIPLPANNIILDLGKIIEDSPDINSKTISDMLKDSKSSISVNRDKLAKELGGGKQTIEEIENSIIQAVETGATGKQIRNIASHNLYKNATSLLGHTYGSAAGVLTPYKSFSKSAESLQKLLNHRYSIKFFTRTEQNVEGDFNEIANHITGDLNNEFLTTLEPIAINQLTGEMEDKVNTALNLAVRGRKTGDKQIDEAGAKIANSFKKIGTELYKAGILKHKVENYFPRMWDRKAIELDAGPTGKNKLAELFVTQGEAKNITEGKSIVKGMLEKENQLSSGTSGHFFSSKRVFKDIKDDAEISEFLNSDIRATIHNYNFQAGKSLAKKKILGVTNENGFINTWINKIDSEMTAAGKPLSKGEKETILDLYRTTTGENLDRYGTNTQNLVDGYTLATRAALLGLATPSSLTEIMINFSKAGFVNSIKGFRDAREQSFKLVTGDINTMLQNKHGLTAKEAYREQQKVAIGQEQAMSQIGNRIAGDDLVNDKMQKLNNKFFRITLLDQWTKFVQRSSYFSARHFIQENLETVAKNGKAPITNKVRSAMNELKELDINPDQGVQWLNSGAKKDDAFYQTIVNGAGRYTNDVILNPTGMAGTRPILHSKPTTSVYFQLMGYPAAFSNVVLKGAAKKMIQDPVRNVPKTIVTALLMTETARQINWLRSRGESEKNKSSTEIYLGALSRTGGLGLLADTAMKTEKASGFTRSPSAAVATSFLGPIAGDVSSAFLKGPAQTIGGKVPFYSVGTAVLGREAMKKYRTTLRELDAELLKGLQMEDKYRAPDRFSKGGEVDVPNAPSEPDERINKLTGLPYNYEAGSAYMDEDDPLKTQRGGFVLGGAVKGITKILSEPLATVIQKYSKGSVTNEVAEKAASRILKNFKGSDDMPSILDDVDVEDYIKLETKVLLEEKHELSTAQIREQFPELINNDGNFGGKEFSKARGYTADEIETFEASGSYDDLLGDTSDIRAEIQAALDDLGLTQKTAKAKSAFSPKGDSGFFSMAEKKAMDLNQSKGSGDQFISMLKKNGVTEDELEFTGFNNEFAGKPKVTKEEVVGYLNVNRLDVESRTGRSSKFDEEDMYGGMDDDIPMDELRIMDNVQLANRREEIESRLDDLGELDFDDGLTPAQQNEMADLDLELEELEIEIGAVREADIDLDGKFTPVSQHIQYSWEGRNTKNYREITLSLPKSKQRGKNVYTTDHFPNQENVVAHVRLADIVTADGKEILLLDELQSDVHKAGSKFGYTNEKEQLKIQEELGKIYDEYQAKMKIFEDEADVLVEINELTVKQEDRLDYLTEEIGTLNRELDVLMGDPRVTDVDEAPVPEMPFKQRKGSGWAQLGIKRALMEAAEKDYDTLAMTTGQQQVDRYAIAIEDPSGFYQRYDRDYIKILNKFGKKYGQKVEMIEVLQGDEIVEVPSIKITEEWKNDIQRGLAQFNKGGTVYKIKSGDTLSQIAKDNNTTVDVIAKANNIKDVNRIYAGLKLTLPDNIKSLEKEVKEITRDNPELTESMFDDAKQYVGKTLNSLKKIVPTNVRMLAYDLTGGKDSLTEKDLREEEKLALIEAAQKAKNKGESSIAYADYGTQEKGKSQYADVGGGGGALDFFSKLNNPEYSMKTTIGQATIEEDKEGNTIIVDQYNFNNADEEISFSRFLSGVRNAGFSPYAQVRNIAREFGSSEGEGSEVRINLGKLASVEDLKKLKGLI